jgi:formylglycine-generating enzyme required for sulfatase activity
MKKLILMAIIIVFAALSCGKPEEPVSETPEPVDIVPPEGMVLIPAGYFTMGEDSGKAAPKHKVWIDAFFMDKYEVTNRQYRTFIEATGHPKPPWLKDRDLNKLDQPVVGISYDDALAYAHWAGKRLPTEAEWEYAARGGLENNEFPWGNDAVEKRCNYSPMPREKDGYEYTAPVGKYAPNNYGLYDMAGNVWEWCHDFYSLDYYRVSPERNPPGPDSGYTRVLRGGSWLSISAKYLKCSARMELKPFVQDRYYGFRCAKTP